MNIKPIDNTSFGVYKKTIITGYGHKMVGTYKGNNIIIHYDQQNNIKMFYVTNNFNKWIKSKLEYFQNGVKKIIWSYANGRK